MIGITLSFKKWHGSLQSIHYRHKLGYTKRKHKHKRYFCVEAKIVCHSSAVCNMLQYVELWAATKLMTGQLLHYIFKVLIFTDYLTAVFSLSQTFWPWRMWSTSLLLQLSSSPLPSPSLSWSQGISRASSISSGEPVNTLTLSLGRWIYTYLLQAITGELERPDICRKRGKEILHIMKKIILLYTVKTKLHTHNIKLIITRQWKRW